ncbi:MAG: cytidylate kinase, partial [Phototrophicales bacterium]
MVRDCVANVQRDIAREYSIIADGRDMGSVVFPDADLKFYVTASVEVRSERWRKDQAQQGNDFTIEQAIEKINERDTRDSEREIAPLTIPKDAIVVDTTEMTIEQVTERMLELMQ